MNPTPRTASAALASSPGPFRVALLGVGRSRCDELITRCGLDPELHVAWSAERADLALQALRRDTPDAAVIDLDLPGGAIEMAALLRSGAASTRLVVLVDLLDATLVERLRRLEPDGVLLKRDPVTALVLCLKQLAARRPAPAPRIEPTAKPESDLPRSSDGRRFRLDSPINVLSSREVQILKHLAEGDSAKEVACRLELSAKSVTNHKYRIMQKLGVSDRVKLARLAIREGLVEP